MIAYNAVMEKICKVDGCQEPIGGNKCGSLCHKHWAEKSSSSLRRIVDDPEADGGGPEPGDPTEEEIWEEAKKIRENRTSHRGSSEKSKDIKVYRLHLPNGMNIKDFENDDLE